MSNVNAELERIQTARSSLQKFRLKLLRPTASTLDAGSADLAAALNCLKSLDLLTQGQRSARDEQLLRFELAILRRELQQVNALMENASHFYQGWARLVSSAVDDASANYTAQGKPGAQISIKPKQVVILG